MVLEVLVSPAKATGKPWEMFFIGAVYSLVAILLSNWVFRSYSSLVMVSFAAIAAVPFVHNAIDNEESKAGKGSLLDKHGRIMSMFLFLFVGFVTTYLLVFVVLPQGIVEGTFAAQVSTINSIRNMPTGNFYSIASSIGKIFLNNTRVLLFCLIFSFFYGAGAIFILSWNASVMGTAIGATIRKGVGEGMGGYFSIIPVSILGYFAHGIPEILAYVVAGLAGGIISVALMKEGIKSRLFREAGIDSLNLLAFAVILLVFATLIEVFVSPNFL